MVKVAFSRPKKNALAVLPYTRVIRFWAMLPSGSSCRVNWACHRGEVRAQREGQAGHLGRGRGRRAADVLVPHQVQGLLVGQPGRGDRGQQPDEAHGGWFGRRRGAGVEGRERVEAGVLAQQQELQDAQAQGVRQPAVPEHRADGVQGQRGRRAEAERRR